MAIKTKAQLATESASTFVDNSTGLITPSLHRTYNTDTIDSFLSVKDASELQAVMLENRANSIASGTTVDLSGANGNLVHITGTSTITSFGSVQAGARFVLVFDDILLLTYNATSLILPTSANITTAVGDTAFLVSEGSGNWRCVAYQRASGAALVGGSGGSQNLQDVTDTGNTTSNDIKFLVGAGLLFSNDARLREGTTDAGLGGAKGIAQICSINYELKWEAGRLYVMEQNGFTIRASLFNFSTTPTINDDDSKGFNVNTIWTLDNGTTYKCTDKTTGAAVWVLQSSSSVAWGDITGTLADQTDLQSALDAKFDNPVGASSDYLDGTGAVVTFPTIPAAQIQSDWTQTTNTALDYIKNKPTIPAAQIQSDWTQTNNTALDYIKNKPAVGSGTVTNIVTAGLLSGGPITTSGTITTSINTNKLVGRTSASSGVMEEISIGSGLTLSGGTLTNTATPTPLGYYGQYLDYNNQVATADNVGVPIIFSTPDINNGVTVVSNGASLTRITFAYSGVYNLQFSIQLQNLANSAEDVHIWLRLNGADVIGSTGVIGMQARKSAGDPSHTISGWNYLLDVIGGQYYELIWSTTNHANVEIQFYASTVNHPSTASTLFTVTQQSGIMAGTGLTSLNGISAITNPVQTFATPSTSGTAPNWSSAGTAHTLNLPLAATTSVTAGLISKSEYDIFNGKQATITGGATTITSSNLTASRALVSDASGKVATNSVTSAELGYVSGVTSAIQTQLGTKALTTLVGSPCEIQLAASDETTTLTTGVSKVTFRMPYAMTVTSVRASVNTQPTGSGITVDVKENGTSIMTTTKISIPATTKTSVGSGTPVLTDTALADDSEISVDILAVGSTFGGSGLKVTIIGTRA